MRRASCDERDERLEDQCVAAELRARMQERAALAELGLQALATREVSTLLADAAALVARTLHVDYCKVLELLLDGRALRLRAGVGWQAGLVGQATVSAGLASQAGYTLRARSPVVVEDLRTERRLTDPPLLHAHSVISGLSVIIQGRDRPFGVLGAHCTRRRAFTRDDSNFLQAVANVLAQALERHRAEEALRQANAALEARVQQRTAALTEEIAERTRTQAQLAAALQEKDVLLQEVHHRVKNNLQVISSLLSLQGESMRDPQARAAFADSQQRIRAIAVVHETLYRATDLTHLDLGTYFRELAAHIFRAYGADRAAIALRVEAPAVLLDMKRAVPCGLILTELLSNCLKHAFPGGRGGEIHVELRPEPAGQITITVRDSGVGVPAGLDLHATPSLGWSLVTLLTEQLGGTLVLERSPGTTVTIIFPA
jgi:two-component sensor histidine kinase